MKKNKLNETNQRKNSFKNQNLFWLVVFIAVSFVMNAQDYRPIWSNSSLTGMNAQKKSLLSTDSNGNTISVGAFNSSMTVGTTTLANAGGNDIFIIKYNYNGAIVWAKKIGGSGDDFADSVTTDIFGNIYLAGSFASTEITFKTGVSLSKSGESDFFVAKFDSQGNAVWAKSATGSGSENATAVKTDATGNIYLAGTYKGSSLVFGGTTLPNSGSASDIFIAKLDADGNYIWEKSNADGEDDDYVTALALDASNNIYASGYFSSSSLKFNEVNEVSVGNTQPSTAPDTPPSTTFFGDGFVGKFDSNGNALWIKAINGNKLEKATSIALDHSGNIYVIGYSQSDMVSVTNSTEVKTSYPQGAAFGLVLKFDTGGNALWIKNSEDIFSGYGGYTDYTPSAIALDKNDFIYCVFNKEITPGRFTPFVNAQQGSIASQLVKLDAAGATKTIFSYRNHDEFYSYHSYFGSKAINGSAITVDDFGIALSSFNTAVNTFRFNTPFCGTVNELPSGFNWYAGSAGGDALVLGTPVSDATLTNKTYYGARIINGVESADRTAFSFSFLTKTFYMDADGDGYGDIAQPTLNCTAPAGYVINQLDCDDADTSANILKNWWIDHDGDGYGDVHSTEITSCHQPSGYVSNNNDCNDSNSNIHGAWYYKDADGDGYVVGPPAYTINDEYVYGDRFLFCTDTNTPAFTPPSGYVATTSHIVGSDDCNDATAAIHPGASEVSFNNADDDCNSYIDDAKILTGYVSSATDLISSESVALAEGYRFKIRQASTNVEKTFVSSTNSFSLSKISGLYSRNEGYIVSVALKYNGVWKGYGPEALVSTPSEGTTLLGTQCTANITNLANYAVNLIPVPDAKGYKVSVFNGESSYELLTTNSYFNFSSIPASFKSESTAFQIKVQVKGKNGLYGNMGSSCSLIVPKPIKNTLNPPTPSTKVIATQCGATLAALNTAINATAVSGATGYVFEVNGVTYDKDTPKIILTNLLGIDLAYDTDYKIRVAVKKNGLTYGFGDECSVKTPVSPTTKVIAAQCGTTLATVSAVVYADAISGATEYKFEINGTNYSSASRGIRLADLPAPFAFTFNTTYSIRVAVKKFGIMSDFGDTCTVTTLASSITKVRDSQCGATLAALNTSIYANPVAYARGYVFKINGTDYPSAVRYIRLTDIFGSVPYNTTYHIRVAAIRYNKVCDFGGECTVTTPASPTGVAKSASTGEGKSDFEIKGYPNPFADNFNLSLTTSSEENVRVTVYDMIGKLIEQREVNPGQVSELQIGNQYATGIYNIIVTQGTEVKTLRMIKQ